MNNSRALVLAVILGGNALFSCRNNRMRPESKSEIPCPLPQQVSFSKDVLPILVNECAITGCHTGRTPEGNLNLDADKAYSSLSNKRSGYIDTLTPKYSVLYGTLISTSDPMPPTGKLDQCKLDMIERWMAQKAKNN